MFKANSADSYFAFLAKNISFIGESGNSDIILPDHVNVAFH